MRKSLLYGGIVVALLAAGGLSSGLTGCAGERSFLPTVEELSAPGGLAGGADVETLRRGRAIYVTECTACHRLFPPKNYSPEQWRVFVRKMAPRASLSGSQAADLLMYLSAASRTGK